MFGSKARKFRPAIAAAAIAGVFFLFGLVTIDDFGVTWDEPLHFSAGDLYLNRIFKSDMPIAVSDEDFEEDVRYYGPVFDIWGALNHQIFTSRLGILAEDNARHLHLLLSGALTIYFTVLLAWESLTPRVGIFSGLFLAAFPRFVGHSFNNPKDIPLTLVFVCCLYIFYRRLKSGRKGYSLLLLLAGGVGFATRIQYLIAPILIIILLIIYNSIIRDEGSRFVKKLVGYWDIPLALLLTVPLGMLFWPYFWTTPWDKLKALIDFYLRHQVQAKLLVRYLGEDYIPGLTLPWHYVPVMLAVTTPILILGSVLLGLGVTLAGIFRRPAESRTKFVSCFYLIWILLGLVPFMIPGQRVYGGIRHFLFVVPALCVISGRGLDWIFTRFRRRVRLLARGAVLIIFILIYGSTYSYHPYYTTYFNHLVGGPRGAFGRFSLENWGNAYKPACRWLNREAPPGSTVLALVAEGVPRWYLRPDIEVFGPRSAQLAGGRYDYSIYILRDYDPLFFPGKDPVFQIQVKNQPICKVHRW